MSKRHILILLLFCSAAVLLAQQRIEISEIRLPQDIRTRPNIILNELVLTLGMPYERVVLDQLIEESRNNLFNLGLFTEVKIELEHIDNNQYALNLKMKEGISWFVVPDISLQEGSLQRWIEDYNFDLGQLNWGAKAKFYNLTGRRDEIRASLQTGFTNSFYLAYRSPFILNNRLRISPSFSYQTNNEVITHLDNHENVFFRSDNEILTQTTAEIRASYRENLRTTHAIGLQRITVLSDEVLLEVQPDLLGGQKRVDYFTSTYSYTRDYRDNRFYPTQGYALDMGIRAEGLLEPDVRSTVTVSPRFSWYKPLSERLFYENRSLGAFTIAQGSRPTFFNDRLLDEEIQIRGYQHKRFWSDNYWIIKNNINFSLIEGQVDYGRWMPARAYQEMPWQVFLSAGMDIGKIYHGTKDDFNPLYNEVLSSATLGTHVLLYGLYTFTAEVSYNAQKEVGFYFNFRSSL